MLKAYAAVKSLDRREDIDTLQNLNILRLVSARWLYGLSYQDHGGRPMYVSSSSEASPSRLSLSLVNTFRMSSLYTCKLQ